MVSQVIATLGALLAGAILCWGFHALVRPKSAAILLVPLILPAVIWFGISGQLSEVKVPGGVYLKFAAVADAPINNFTGDSDVSTRLIGVMISQPQQQQQMQQQQQQMQQQVQVQQQVPDQDVAPWSIPSSAEYGANPIPLLSEDLTRGEVSGREIYRYTYDGLEPPRLISDLRALDERMGADTRTQFLAFGPELGILDCYLMDIDLIDKGPRVYEMLDALAEVGIGRRQRFLEEADLCVKPLRSNATAVEALRRMADANHDEAIVVKDDGTYSGIVYRDRILSALIDALAGAKAAKVANAPD